MSEDNPFSHMPKVHPRLFHTQQAYGAILVSILKLECSEANMVAAFTPAGVFSVEADPEVVTLLRKTFEEGCEKYALTPGERLMALGSILQDIAKYTIRYERHGNYETRGGEE